MRIGFGFDVHQLEVGRDFWLGGIKIEQADPLVVGGEYPGGNAGFSGVVPETGLRWLYLSHQISRRGKNNSHAETRSSRRNPRL